MIARFTSRKLLLAIAAIVYIAVQVAGGTLSQAAAADAIYKLVIAYIAAEGIGDAAERAGAARAAGDGSIVVVKPAGVSAADSAGGVSGI